MKDQFFRKLKESPCVYETRTTPSALLTLCTDETRAASFVELVSTDFD